MSDKAKTTGNGNYDYNCMRTPDTRSKLQIFKDAIYNPTDGAFLGRTKEKWGVVGLFYLAFYSVLAVLCAICMLGLMATIDEHRPKYTLDSSIIGTNPGLGFRPTGRVEDGPLVKYAPKNTTQIKEWVALLNKFLEPYIDKTKLPNSGRNQVICDFDKPPKEGKACAVDTSVWEQTPCSPTESFGFNNSAPCVFIKLNRIFDWVPEYYNQTNDLPAEMPDDLKEHIHKVSQANNAQLNTVWISCNGETATDRENLKDIEYFPPLRGFPGYFYPFKNHKEYLSPVVAVHFKRPNPNVLINIECRGWAKNIVYASRKGEKAGAVHFELMIVN